ncbi:hypothetical protein SAMN05421803_109212 [Nocardiopsis flavescens]|uniref:Uncharacterized protein n=1 Tax=Nocardiopsis flavescens TaxID=758803 RepID=A0A1M6M6I7_9ACTN|nr:ABC transporter substrate-binding protein [Nocardiopsis flavescens]SHJ79010.1 hypothetical protein SAMN05421803_109212 [Nocardiopsis flavescens]
MIDPSPRNVTAAAEALKGLRTVVDPDRRRRLVLTIRRWLDVGGIDAPAALFATELAVAALEQGELSGLMRVIRHLEEGTESVRTATRALSGLLRLEEDSRLTAMVPAPHRVRAREVLSVLRARLAFRPCGPLMEDYRVAMGDLENLTVPVHPLDLWDMFLDLADAPPRDGRVPLVEFAAPLVRGEHADLVPLLRMWVDLRGLGGQEALGPPGRARAEEPPGGAPPARLLIRFRHDTGDLYRFEWWQVLSPGPGEEPVVGPRNDGPYRIGRPDFADEVCTLLQCVEMHPYRRYHDRVRVEIVVPLGMLPDLDAARWEPRAAEGEPVRLGVAAELTYRVEEFFMGQKMANVIARESSERRWNNLLKVGESEIFDIQCDPLPQGVRLAEYVSDDGVILFATGHQEREDLIRMMSTAVRAGVPVIAWRTGAHPSAGDFRSALTGREGKVSSAVVGSLPRRLHRHRSGRSFEAGGPVIVDGFDVGLVYHDRLPHPFGADTPLSADVPHPRRAPSPDEAGKVGR